MLDFSDIKVVLKEENKNKGIYEIAPIVKGYGNTLVNPLRRILLSSIEGVGITSVKIEGVDHEYTTIEGIKEDVVEIILNLKNIKFKMLSGETQVLKLSFSGKGTVKASDIKLNQNIEIVDDSVVIANSSSDKLKLEMDIVVEKGIGYKDADEGLRNEVGRIPVACDFSPVKLVNMEVGKARKGQDMHWDSVLVTIETDGSVEPREALIHSAKILQQFSGKIMMALGIAQEEVKELEEESIKISEEVNKTDETEVMGWNIEDLEVSKRTKTALLNAGYANIRDLASLTQDELKSIRGLGTKSYGEISEILTSYGVNLAKETI